MDRYRSVTQYKVRTLDEAFGSVLPKGAKLPAYRMRREKGLQAYLETEAKHEAGAAIDQELFESVGKDLGISASKVRDYYYAAKKFWDFQEVSK